MKEVVLDTETTGISVKDGHRIVEIGCIELDNLVPTSNKFHCYINPERRVSKIDTVKVTEKFKVERYSHVMHIVSNVVGKFNNKYSKFDTLLSGFPAGTVSGAPKIRAMEIIDELEKTKRKVYAGGIGYFSANGE